ncbi:MAG TPA: CopD family protein [Candidatus Thermoplasmatota archaeon]|nr:CopD family protein [Candidatus Thermoplasmatota archaeon]
MRVAPVLAFVALLALVPAAAGHANLLASDPPANSAAPEAPREIHLRFTEPLEPAFAKAAVADARGRIVSGPPRVADDPRTLVMPLEAALPDGGYTVTWKVVSTVDGHTTRGIFGFAVGNGTVPVGGAGASEVAVPEIPELAGKAASFIGAALAVGVPFFALFVARGEHAGAGGWVLPRVAIVGLVVAFAGVLAQFLAVAARLHDVAFTALGPEAIVATALTREGNLFAVRALLAVVAFGALLAGRGRTGDVRPFAWRIALVAGVVSLIAASLSSHAAGVSPRWLGVGLDWIHFTAASIWLGGLAALGALLARQGGVAWSRALVPRFSAIAFVAVPVLVIAGGLSSYVHVPNLEGYVESGWGRLVAIKAALVLPLLALGAYNRYVLEPRIRRGEESVIWKLARSVRLELSLGMVVVVLAAVLGALPPPGYGAPGSATSTTTAGGFEGTLVVVPAAAGVNRVSARVVDLATGEPPAGVLSAEFEFIFAERDLGRGVAPAAGGGSPGTWVAHGAHLSTPGAWDVGLYLELEGRPDVTLFWRIQVSE